MNRKSDKASYIFTDRNFPNRFKQIGMSHRVLIGIGGNIGDVQKRFTKLLNYMRTSRLLRPIETSLLLKNPPFGYSDQPDFINSLIMVETELEPRRLMRYLLWIEKRFGRKRSFPNAPRTLDLDIIFFANLHLRSRWLTIPHPRFSQRDSVMIPLCYILLKKRSRRRICI